MLSLFNFDKVRQECEPVRYNYARDNISYAVAMEHIMADVVG